MQDMHAAGELSPSHFRGGRVELEGRLRDKEMEVEQLRKALAKAGVKQEIVASPDDHVSARMLTTQAYSFLPFFSVCLWNLSLHISLLPG